MVIVGRWVASTASWRIRTVGTGLRDRDGPASEPPRDREKSVGTLAICHMPVLLKKLRFWHQARGTSLREGTLRGLGSA
jgi:hypothetical protein